MTSRPRWTTILPFLHPSPCRTNGRHFSTSQERLRHEVKVREKPQKSFKVLMKQQEQGDGSNLPDDLGLLEGIHALPY